MKNILALIFLFLTNITFGQFPFEKHPSISYSKYYRWKIQEKEEQIDKNLSIPKFYKNGDTLTIKITSFGILTDSSFVRLYRNSILSQTFFEPATFNLGDSSDIIFDAAFSKRIFSINSCGVQWQL